MAELGTVTRALLRIARDGTDDHTLARRIGQICVDGLDIDGAAMSLLTESTSRETLWATDATAELLEDLQFTLNEGACMEATATGRPVLVADLRESTATAGWPIFAAAVRTYASVHAIPLRLRGQAIGALNLFHREPGALPDADLALGQALTDVATIGILQERAIRRGEVVNEQLQTALNSRVVIEQVSATSCPFALGVSGRMRAQRLS